eukprot:jgi/Bigna1/88164/estExt_fgenesh1_pg.C_280201
MPPTLKKYSLVGPDELFRDAPFMGEYEEDASKKNAKRKRKVSVHKGGKFKLFFCEPKGQWIVGKDDSSGEGWLFVEDEAITPDKVTGNWSFWDSRENDWVAHPQLMVIIPGSHKTAVSTDSLPLTDLSDKMAKLSIPEDKDGTEERKGGGGQNITKKLTIDSFQTLRVIGRGSFGEVRIAKKKDNNRDVFAIKQLKKRDMIKRDQVRHVWGERRFLASTDESKCQWVVKLFHTFQDKRHLYFVLEFCPGGDLLRLLVQKDRFSEKDTAFYIAELACGVKCVHDNGYIHRDIKPDNILLTKEGHLKLTDFGLCKQMAEDADKKLWEDVNAAAKLESGNGSAGGKGENSKRRRRQLSCVGTPDYVAPEVLKRQYGKECDWWSVGVILFECICGYPPFMSQTLQETAKRILKWKSYLKFPDRPVLSPNAKSAVTSFLTDAKSRITWDGIVGHPFFAHINWKKLHVTKPPFQPLVRDKFDDGNFDKFKSVRGNSIRSVKGDTQRLKFPEFTWNRKETPLSIRKSSNNSSRKDAFSLFSQENSENIPTSIHQN